MEGLDFSNIEHHKRKHISVAEMLPDEVLPPQQNTIAVSAPVESPTPAPHFPPASGRTSNSKSVSSDFDPSSVADSYVRKERTTELSTKIQADIDRFSHGDYIHSSPKMFVVRRKALFRHGDSGDYIRSPPGIFIVGREGVAKKKE